MQHQLRLAAQQTRSVDAEREVLADTLLGVGSDRGLCVGIGPEVFHLIPMFLLWRPERSEGPHRRSIRHEILRCAQDERGHRPAFISAIVLAITASWSQGNRI